MNKYASKIKTTGKWALRMFLPLVFAFSATASYASPAATTEYYGRVSTKSAKPPVANVAAVNAQTAQEWFEKYDELVGKYRTTSYERVILGRSLNQDEGRVREWIKVAADVSRKYKQLAKSIRCVNAPAKMSDLQQYGSLMAEWYEDASLVYDEMIKPRMPAHSQEELDRQLACVRTKALSLSSTNGSLKTMDMTLRQQYRVGPPQYDDEFGRYVSNK